METNPMRIRGVLLDMDGLLLDTERLAERCWTRTERETGFRMPEGFYHSLIGQSMHRIRERLHAVMSPACDVGGFIATANRIYRDALTGEAVPVKPGASALLGHLAARGVPRCLATSTFHELCRHKLENSGLAPWLTLRVCGDEVAHSKPEPDIYLEAGRRLGLPCRDLLVLEDSENGLRAALAAGCRVAHVPDIGPVSLAVQGRVDRVYRDLWQVLAAFERGEIVPA